MIKPPAIDFCASILDPSPTTAAVSPVSTITPLPAPGLAVFPQYIAKQETTIEVNVDSSLSFTDLRTHRVDHAPGSRHLFELRKYSFSYGRSKFYAADCPDKSRSLCIPINKSDFSRQVRSYLVTEKKKGPRILEVISNNKNWLNLGQTSEIKIVFPNSVDGGKQVELNYTHDPFVDDKGTMTYGNVTLGDKVVAILGKQILGFREPKFHITVAEGCDLFIPTVLAWAIYNKVEDGWSSTFSPPSFFMR